MTTKRKERKKSPFEKTRSTEAEYARSLRRIAREIGRIVDRFKPSSLSDFPPLRNALDQYRDLILPWAKAKAALVVGSVDRQDSRAWRNATAEMGAALRQEIKTAPTGKVMRELMDEQVKLITSLPTEAAERVHKLVMENVETGGRSTEIAKEIARSGEVTASRATLIARTEVSRASTILTQARAEHIGSTGYIWRTVHDSDVRPSHKKMEGKFVDWNDPPTLDGLTGHAGALPNCRCYPEPIIPRITE